MWRPPEVSEASGLKASAWLDEAAPILMWCDHTAIVERPTGIQRVVFALARELSTSALLVGWDSWRRNMRPFSAQEHRKFGRPDFGFMPIARGDWLLIAEMPASAIAAGVDPISLAHALDLRAAALVHDLIPVLAPEPYTPQFVDLYRDYLRSLTCADLLFATTRHVANQLDGFFAAEGLRAPPVAVVPLAAELPGVERVRAARMRSFGEPLELLTVSRWEPRKNVPLLLRAIEQVRTSGREIRLTLVGRRGGFPNYDHQLDEMLARMPWANARAETHDVELPALYACHDATIYPSLDEGFGLPIGESMWCGRPCLQHDGSAMAEIAPGGGTYGLDMANEATVAAALCCLHDDPFILAELTGEIAMRPLRRWADVAFDVSAVLSEA